MRNYDNVPFDNNVYSIRDTTEFDCYQSEPECRLQISRKLIEQMSVMCHILSNFTDTCWAKPTLNAVKI